MNNTLKIILWLSAVNSNHMDLIKRFIVFFTCRHLSIELFSKRLELSKIDTSVRILNENYGGWGE
jgi:hypothetical protein